MYYNESSMEHLYVNANCFCFISGAQLSENPPTPYLSLPSAFLGPTHPWLNKCCNRLRDKIEVQQNFSKSAIPHLFKIASCAKNSLVRRYEELLFINENNTSWSLKLPKKTKLMYLDLDNKINKKNATRSVKLPKG